MSEINDGAAQILGLPDEAWDVPHKKWKGIDTGSEVEYRFRWTRTILKSAGLVINSERGVWALVNPNIDLAAVDPKAVTRLHRELSRSGAPRATATAQADEQASEPAAQTEQDWMQEVLEAVRAMSPVQFERLTQRLLREAGFVEVHVTGKTGDGGIDGKGIVRVNHVVSFHVVFQSKRYSGTVSGEEIRAFRGAVEGRADRGLFITSGRYTSSAKAEATREGARPIDLIDGNELAEMLRRFGLGVRTRTVEQIEIDSDWFKTV